MALTRQDVEKVALLARLQLEPEELDQLTGQLARVLEYVDQLSQLDTSNVAPLAHAVELTNVFREDEPGQTLPREQALANAPRSDGRFYLVPAVLGE